MQKEILRKIGLTEGEIRVYIALVKLGRSSTGKIMDESEISSSKVYLILEKLIKKGFVSYTLENNIKIFSVTNPINIIDYIENQQKALETTKQEAKLLSKQITQLIGSYNEETVQIHKGIKGIQSAFYNILNELKNTDEFIFFGTPELAQKEMALFLKNFHAKRIKKEIITKGIIDIEHKKVFINISKDMDNIEFKFVDLIMPQAITIGKTRVVFTLWGDNPIAFEIISKRLAKKYRNYFYKVWNRNQF